MKQALKRWLKQWGQRIAPTDRRFDEVSRHLEHLAMVAGKVAVKQQLAMPAPQRLEEAEFKIFSQFGDDGIIAHLTRRLAIPPARRTFIEFGVEDYQESNTRFLLFDQNWRGLVLDGSADNVARIRSQRWYALHELTAVSAFIDQANVNSLFREHGMQGEIGLLSIDIDGNDYWVWDAIDGVDPWLVVSEYNSVFGETAAVTVPYAPAFTREAAHPSKLYYGASLQALITLASHKGYVFVGCNSAGNNSYFVRKDKAPLVADLIASAQFVRSRFREARDAAGELVTGDERALVIQHLPVWDVRQKRVLTIAEACLDGQRGSA